MKKFRYFSILLLISLPCVSSAIELEYPKTESELELAFSELDFEITPKKYSFSNANQSFDLPANWMIFQGENARKFLFYNNGADIFRDVGSVALSDDFAYQLIFTYYNEGYIEDSDWEQLDADALMEGIVEGTTEANLKRRANGVAPLTIKGWVKKPTYDREKDVAFYEIEAESEGESILNSVALKLGKEGFTKITLVGPSNNPQQSSETFIAGLNRHSFDDGYRYSDYQPGDKLAGIGLASLVALTAGSKNGKGVAVGLMAILLALAKKFWFVIFLPFVFIWKKIKRKD